ncbi:hypothetical protein HK098_001643 [Nowakowskiella sp. JEL0407]|nr:hypothetical protein HK098_001643 [Nowakowskiella sp. JEL0407]
MSNNDDEITTEALLRCAEILAALRTGTAPSPLHLEAASIACDLALQLRSLSFPLNSFAHTQSPSSSNQPLTLHSGGRCSRQSSSVNDNNLDLSRKITFAETLFLNAARKSSLAASLPVEIITMIMKYILNPLPIMNAQAQSEQRQTEQQTLLSCGKVNHQWRLAVIPVLWKDPWLKDRKTVLKILLSNRLSTLRRFRNQSNNESNMQNLVISSNNTQPHNQIPAVLYGYNIQRLDLRAVLLSEPDDTPLLQLIASEFPFIRVLRLNVHNLNFMTLQNFFTKCLKLKYLSLLLRDKRSKRASNLPTDAMDVDMTNLIELQNGFGRLEVLDLYEVNVAVHLALYRFVSSSVGPALCYLNLGRSWVKDEVVVGIARNCPNLTSVWLEENASITDVSIHALARYCKYIKTLKLRNCSNIGDDAIQEITKHCLLLEALGISYTQCSDRSLHCLTQYSEYLNTLFINDLSLRESTIAALCVVRGNTLCTLGMCGLDAISNYVIKTLSETCPNLEQLDVGGCMVTEEYLALVLEGCPRLKAFVFDQDSVSEEFMKRLKERYSVEQFWLEPPAF